LSLFNFLLCIIRFLVFARDGMRLWLGDEFAARSTVVLQWLVLGILANSLAQMAYALVQAAGRARDAAILHLVELPLYLLLLGALLRAYGIEGVAWAWCARMTVDALIMLGMARRILGSAIFGAGERWGALAGLTAIAGAFAVQGLPLYFRAPYVMAGFAAALALVGSRGMAQERAALMSMLAPRGRSAARVTDGASDSAGDPS
jgi:O-antigen/teichoic acid export membrane protein